MGSIKEKQIAPKYLVSSTGNLSFSKMEKTADKWLSLKNTLLVDRLKCVAGHIFFNPVE